MKKSGHLAMPTFCHPTFSLSLKSTNTSSKTKMKLSLYFQFEASLEIILWLRTVIEMPLTSRHFQEDMKAMLFRS